MAVARILAVSETVGALAALAVFHLAAALFVILAIAVWMATRLFRRAWKLDKDFAQIITVQDQQKRLLSRPISEPPK